MGERRSKTRLGLWSLGLFLAVQCLAADEPDNRQREILEQLAKYKGQYRVAWEIEASLPQLEHLVEYFDFRPLIADKKAALLLTAEEREDYLHSMEAFEALPAPLRATLERGAGPPSRFLLDPMMAEQIQLEKLRAEWKKLPPDTRNDAISLEHLAPWVKARLLHKHGKSLKARADLPAGVLELLSHLDWSPDMTNLEFRFRDDKPMEDLAELERLRDRFGRLIQSSRGFNDTKPVEKGKGVSYHLHMSVKDGRDVTGFLRTYNLLQSMRLYVGGREDVMQAGMVGYTAMLESKGVVRKLDATHFEVRSHAREPGEELLELAELLAAPERDAQLKMVQELRTYLTPERIALLERARPDAILQLAAVLANHGDTETLAIHSPAVQSAMSNFASADRLFLWTDFLSPEMPEGETTRAITAGIHRLHEQKLHGHCGPGFREINPVPPN